MIKFVLTFLVVCFFAVDISAGVEWIKPTTIGDSDQWDSTGSGTKPQMLTDATDGNYIYTGTATRIDRYELDDVSANISTVDSLVIYWRGQDDGTGNNRAQLGIRIGTDVATGTNVALTASWVDYTESILSPPGSRGTWDDFEVDSAVLRIECTAIGGGRTVRMTVCSVGVFTTPADYNDLFFTNDAGCRAGDNFGKEMSFLKPLTTDTLKVDVVSLGTRDNYMTADTAYEVQTWNTGSFNIITNYVFMGATPDSIEARILAVAESNCATVVDSTGWSTKKSVNSTGVDTIFIPNYEWISATAGTHTVQVEFKWTNPSGEGLDDTVWIEVGNNDTRLEHELTMDYSTGGAGLPGDCTENLDTLNPTADAGSPDQWTAETGAKWDAVSDGVDDSLIWEATNSQAQQFIISDDAIPGDATMDTLYFEIRGKRRQTVGGAKAWVRPRLHMTSGTNYCEWANIRLTTSWALYTLATTGLPSGANQCAGALDSESLDSIEFRFILQQQQKDDTADITEARLVICYTEAGAGGGQVIRIQLGIKDDPLGWAEKQWWAGRDHPLYPERGTVWGITKDSKWEISKCDKE